jgi:hypothetical protein
MPGDGRPVLEVGQVPCSDQRRHRPAVVGDGNRLVGALGLADQFVQAGTGLTDGHRHEAIVTLACLTEGNAGAHLVQCGPEQEFLDRKTPGVPVQVPYLSQPCLAMQDTSAASSFQVNRAVVQNTCRRLCQVHLPSPFTSRQPIAR